MRARSAFTLIELLVVIAIMSLLVSILLPALQKARQMAYTTNCLVNMRNMQLAHWMYMMNNDDWFIDVGLGHGGAHANEPGAWINTLAAYYGSPLLHRCPVDRSPHWPITEGGAGEPVPGSGGQKFRRTSFGINNFLTSVAPNVTGAQWRAYRRLNQVPSPSVTVHFLIMAFTGPFAGSDHIHVENWMPHPDAPPIIAAGQVQTNAHGGPEKSWQSRSNYGFLDGRAETLTFQKVFRDWNSNRFDPQVAH